MNKKEPHHRIKLFDTQNAFIGELDIFRTDLPVVVLWGDRVFVRHSGTEPDSYYENPEAGYRIRGLFPYPLRLGW